MTALARVDDPPPTPPAPDLFELALAELGFGHRAEQDRLVTELRTGGDRVAVQAGTGTGKSVAALCVAAERGRPGCPAVIVTMTNALTEQYARKDAPAVADAIGMTYTRVIGRSHYLCASSAEGVRAVGTGPDEPGPDDDADDMMERWIAARDTWLDEQAALNPTATWATQWEAHRDLHPREYRCPGKCGGSVYGGCGARKARDRGATVDVVITNAHVLIYHRRYDFAKLLPENLACVIVDEAHQLPDTVSSTLAARIGETFGASWVAAERDTDGSLLESARNIEVGEDDDGRPQYVTISGPEIRSDLIDVVQQVRDEIVSAIDWRQARAPEVRVRASSEQRDRLRTALTDYTRWANALATGTLGAPAPPDETAEDTAPEAVGVIDTIELLTMTTSVASVVASVSRGTPDEIAFVRTKVETITARALGERAALISGTLPPSLPARVGWRDVTPVDVGHPFDYAAQVRGWISTHSGVKSCPARITGPAREAWFARLARTYAARAAEVDRFIGTGGRGLVLVPSHADIDVLREHLIPRLEARGVPVFVQPREGGSPAALAQAREFRTQYERDGGPAVLIGTESLATGVDLPGDLLTRVVWWCLPIGFTSPADEQREALYPGYRADRLRMRVAQGIGRLMRRTSDSGWVLLSDERFNRHLVEATGILDKHLREIPWTRLRVREAA